MSLIVAPLLGDVVVGVRASDRLKSAVVAASGATGDAEISASDDQVRQAILSRLQLTVYGRRSPRASSRPLEYNFARNFPLNNPFLTRYYHVDRSSVRELMRTFERRNGARVWCSVRRSGKTTACTDLGATGTATVVIQTCDTTGQAVGGSIFYESVTAALAGGAQLPNGFFRDAVIRAAGPRANDPERIVCVLDEYETLFGRLKASGRPDNELRYTVVQPLLNQMAEFARDNLLVFLGQQPNAHFILMDQNQLSPHIQQDAFPLFRYNPAAGRTEFGELVTRVLTPRIMVEPDFVAALHDETAGHPFLTVNILVELVDWLIEQARPVGGLTLTGPDFGEFAAARLGPQQVRLSPEYSFFRGAASEAMGNDGRRDTPWLYAMYRVLRSITRMSAGDFACSRSDFGRLVAELGDDAAWNAEELLASGSLANFLAYDATTVRPRIRMLARIASIV